MTTTTTFQGMDPGAKSSSRVLCPPGGASNISFGAEEEKPAKKNKMASSIFAEPDDPHAHRRNNPPGGAATGVLCGESSAPLRRCQPAIVYDNGLPADRQDQNEHEQDDHEQTGSDEVPEQKGGAGESAGGPSGRRNPPGGKSSLILG